MKLSTVFPTPTNKKRANCRWTYGDLARALSRAHGTLCAGFASILWAHESRNLRKRHSRGHLFEHGAFASAPLIVLVLALALILWLVLRDDGGSSSSSAKAVSVGQIRNLAESVGHPVYWVGPKDGYTYELTRQSNGTIIVRYLPQGAKVGDKKPYLSVATYPFPRRVPGDRESGPEERLRLVQDPGQAALPCSPSVTRKASTWPTRAPAIRSRSTTRNEGPPPRRSSRCADRLRWRPAPATASRADLRALAGSVGHPVYWVGPQGNSTFELIRGSGGKIIIRYLPQGVDVGSPKPYLSVATYPFPGASGRSRIGKASEPGDDQAGERRPRGLRQVQSEEHPPRLPGVGLPGRGLRPVRGTGSRTRLLRPGQHHRLSRRRRRPIHVMMSAEPRSASPGAASRYDGSSGASIPLWVSARCSALALLIRVLIAPHVGFYGDLRLFQSGRGSWPTSGTHRFYDQGSSPTIRRATSTSSG